MSECWAWKAVVACADGNHVCSLNSWITSCRRCSSIFRWPFSESRDVPGVLGVLGDVPSPMSPLSSTVKNDLDAGLGGWFRLRTSDTVNVEVRPEELRAYDFGRWRRFGQRVRCVCLRFLVDRGPVGGSKWGPFLRIVREKAARTWRYHVRRLVLLRLVTWQRRELLVEIDRFQYSEKLFPSDKFTIFVWLFK